MTTGVSSGCGAQIHLLPIPSPGRAPWRIRSMLPEVLPAVQTPLVPGRLHRCRRLRRHGRSRMPAGGNPRPPALPGGPFILATASRLRRPLEEQCAAWPARRRSATRLRMRAPISCRARRRKPRRRNGGANEAGEAGALRRLSPERSRGIPRSHLPESPVNVGPARRGRSRETTLNLRQRKFDWIAREKSGKKYT